MSVFSSDNLRHCNCTSAKNHLMRRDHEHEHEHQEDEVDNQSINLCFYQLPSKGALFVSHTSNFTPNMDDTANLICIGIRFNPMFDMGEGKLFVSHSAWCWVSGALTLIKDEEEDLSLLNVRVTHTLMLWTRELKESTHAGTNYALNLIAFGSLSTRIYTLPTPKLGYWSSCWLITIH